uniref:Mitochondrial carrier protein n=1 Tax=Schizophyllum commune (strain H4-8 / FGSC 9210) TaxID=578458 RepID=D8PVU4_SCHCM
MSTAALPLTGRAGSSNDDNDDPETKDTYASLQAALARTATRTFALYFSRPVRLFRPSKVSGWLSLRSVARQSGATVSPEFIRSLVKDHGFMVIPKHFVPPIMVNALLGSVLWTVYAETSSSLDPYIGHHPTLTAAISGAVAGGAQALVAAPAENVRMVLEGGKLDGHSWSYAWKEVFRSTRAAPVTSKAREIEEAREVRTWMREVGEMAGRGWDGWGWGCAKDICGYGVFFAIFEITRRVSTWTAAWAPRAYRGYANDDAKTKIEHNLSRTVTLVTGGVIAGLAYEMVSRPFDVARRLVLRDRFDKGSDHSPSRVILRKVRKEGIIHFFMRPPSVEHTPAPRGVQRLQRGLRAIGRLGPWGVGFLVWEIYGPGLGAT